MYMQQLVKATSTDGGERTRSSRTNASLVVHQIPKAERLNKETSLEDIRRHPDPVVRLR